MCSDRKIHVWILHWAFLYLGSLVLFILVQRLRSVNAEISSSLFQFSNTFLVRTIFFKGRGCGMWRHVTRYSIQYKAVYSFKTSGIGAPRDAASYPRIAGVLNRTVVTTWRLAAFRVFIRYRFVQKPLDIRFHWLGETVGVCARFPEKLGRHVIVERRYFEPFRKSVDVCIVSVTFS
jgi:hypothetical protein